MKKLIAFLLFFLLSCTSSEQSNESWHVFFNQDSTLVGFKDRNGMVKIKPKFEGMYPKQKFENIIYVLERIDGSLMGYYLTKSEITKERNYFENDILMEQLSNQDCGSPFTKEYLLEEQERILLDFKVLMTYEIQQKHIK